MTAAWEAYARALARAGLPRSAAAAAPVTGRRLPQLSSPPSEWAPVDDRLAAVIAGERAMFVPVRLTEADPPALARVPEALALDGWVDATLFGEVHATARDAALRLQVAALLPGLDGWLDLAPESGVTLAAAAAVHAPRIGFAAAGEPPVTSGAVTCCADLPSLAASPAATASRLGMHVGGRTNTAAAAELVALLWPRRPQVVLWSDLDAFDEQPDAPERILATALGLRLLAVVDAPRGLEFVPLEDAPRPLGLVAC